MRRWLRLTALAGALITVAAAGTPAASAANTVGNPVLQDCNSHGAITQNFTLAELRHALAIMPASYKQYGNCPDAINAAILRVKAGKTSAPDSSSGGSFLPTPVIIILVVLLLAAVTFGPLAVRRRSAGSGQGPDGGDPPSSTGPPSAAG